jgi:hypothetical protein
VGGETTQQLKIHIKKERNWNSKSSANNVENIQCIEK